jgi:hypothetical protein
MPDDNNKYQGMYCCTVPMDGVRMLTFSDGTKSGVVGLDEILFDMYREERKATVETAEEIVERLSIKNYIVPSVKSKYAALLLEEYEGFVQGMEKGRQATGTCQPTGDAGRQKKGVLSKLLKGR